MKRLYLYPVWLRIWHWLNAIFFSVLIFTGLSMYYANESDFFLSFDAARLLHNISGITVTFLFVIYVVLNIFSGNFKHYIPKLNGLPERMVKQGRFYLYGIFRGEDHPYHATKDNKFNPLQQLTYFAIMFFMFPIVIISGWFLFFPEYAPEEIMGMGGVWPMVITHITFGFIMSVFMFGHIYLATHGDTIFANFISMFTGYHEVHGGKHENTDTDEENAAGEENVGSYI